MPFAKGHKTNEGRQNRKGVQNKTTLKTKKLIASFMDENFKEVETAWSGLEPLEKVKTYISLVKYVMPVLSSVKVEDSDGEDVLKQFLAKQK